MENLPADYSYLETTLANDLNVHFRIKEVKDAKTAEIWLEKYSCKTFTSWKVSRTYPNAGKYNVFRMDVRCCHFTDRRAQGKRSSKHTACPAKMQIIVKRYLPKSKSVNNDPLIEEWPTIINIIGAHNHSLNSAAVLKYRNMCPETKEKLCSLFRQGHSSSSALLCLKTDFLLEKGDQYFKVAADGFYVPSLSIVDKLFEKEFKTEYGEVSGENMLESLKMQLQSYSTSTNGVAKVCTTFDKHYFVVICSPIMKRVHEKAHQASELVLLDASGGMDKERHRVYFLITPTAAGGLPLGVIITDCEQESVFDEALRELKSILPKDCFFNKQFPETFLTDNDLKEINALRKHFPLTRLLLCHFHVLKAVWSWLCNKKHDINSSDRQELYYLFKKVLYAQNEEDLESMNTTVLLSTLVEQYPKFLKYYKNLWDKKQDWAFCLRQNLKLRGNNTTNYVEIVFRILKDCILERIMAFNLPQLVDYILSRYEMYMEKRLTDFFNGRSPKSILINMLTIKGTDSVRDIRQVSGSDGTYTAISIESGLEYTIDIIGGVCSCLAGQTGKLCKHAAGILLSIDDKVNSLYNTASTKTKETMFYIATGSQPPSNWLKPLNFNPCVSFSHNEDIVEEESLDLTAEENKSVENEQDTHTGQHILENISVKEQEIFSLTCEEEEEFDSLFFRIKKGLKENSSVFVPAVQKLLKNTRKFATTDVGLVSALHTFGSYSGLKSVSRKKVTTRRSHAQHIGVQPTAIGRRKHCLSGKSRVSAGRPKGQLKVHQSLKCHDYTSLGRLPARKRKLRHSLQECVEMNKSLGSNKQRKS